MHMIRFFESLSAYGSDNGCASASVPASVSVPGSVSVSASDLGLQRHLHLKSVSVPHEPDEFFCYKNVLQPTDFSGSYTFQPFFGPSSSPLGRSRMPLIESPTRIQAGRKGPDIFQNLLDAKASCFVIDAMRNYSAEEGQVASQ